MTLRVGSVYSGIGGLDLGLERAGMQIAWQVEIDPFCQKILAKHWPAVTRHGDVLDCGQGRVNELSTVDVLAGGFMCTDISGAGKQAGIGESTRSGITWRNLYRLICELRPRYVIVENVPILLSRGFDYVLGCLAESGYDAEWQVLSACTFGASHMRRRLFIVAYPCSPRLERVYQTGRYIDMQSTKRFRQEWQAEPDVPRVALGIPNRVDRIRGLGNAVVPQVAEYIGHCIVEHARNNGNA